MDKFIQALEIYLLIIGFSLCLVIFFIIIPEIVKTVYTNLKYYIKNLLNKN